MSAPIPEDLVEIYRMCVDDKRAEDFDNSVVAVLIARIAALEAQVMDSQDVRLSHASAVLKIASERDALEAQVRQLRVALEESVKLQSHYAAILNDYDGGERRPFKDSAAWIARLIETGTLAATEPKDVVICPRCNHPHYNMEDSAACRALAATEPKETI